MDEKNIKEDKKKHRGWQRYMETRDWNKYQEYAKLRNQVKKSVKKANMSMERDRARDVKKNPKNFWKYANSKGKQSPGYQN